MASTADQRIPDDTAAQPLPLEEIPGGRYDIVSLIGTGAFGSVYKALDTFLNRAVAIKTIGLDPSIGSARRAALSKRFIREAQVAAQLQHANIVTIHDIIFTPQTGFIVMEFIEGETLQSLLAEKKIPVARAIDIVTQVAKGLEYAHEHTVIHRDIKPGNIMITPSFEARITDFGIAKSEGATHLTMSGSLIGTPDYMSPEQATGEEVDCRSDLFSLGGVFYECLTGEKPFPGTSLTAVLLNIVNKDPLASRTVQALGLRKEVFDVLEGALNKRAEERFATAAEMLGALALIPIHTTEACAESDAAARIDLDSLPETVEIPPNETPPMTAGAETIESLRAERRPLRFTRIASDELQTIALTPAQGFILSRIDGHSRASDIFTVSPIPEPEAAGTLVDLIDRGLLTLDEATDASGSESSGGSGGEKLDSRLATEVARCLRLASERRYSELLGIDISTPTADVKNAYLELVQRFHPDAQAYRVRSADRQKLTRVCAVLTEALNSVSPRKASMSLPRSETSVSNDAAKRKRQDYARELFDRAKDAFETTDFWEAIQLSRQAVELDPEKADYHHLLGIGLTRNQNWMKEAEENLVTALELDPNHVAAIKDLADVYERQGFNERANELSKHAADLVAKA